MKKTILSQTVLVIVLLVTSGVLAVATSAFMVQTVARPQVMLDQKGTQAQLARRVLKETQA